MSPVSEKFAADYAALTGGVGWVDFSSRTQIELTGADRAKFLHNLCTNAVRDLPIGSGCEAFVLNVKGHVIGHVFVFACPDSHVLETVPDQAETLLAHLERYLIREDVQVFDRSQQWAEVFLSGPKAETILNGLGLPTPRHRLDHAAAHVADSPIWIRKVDLAGPDGFLVACQKVAVLQLQNALTAAGARPCNDDSFEAARIEYGTPWFGSDIIVENLPQEIDRDRLAINFTKGCYLGQETVARIDALGHVNRLLRGVKLTGQQVPNQGDEFRSGDKNVGQVTSACWSPKLQSPLALAMLRRGFHEPGTHLELAAGAAEVVALPIASPSVPSPLGRGLG